LDDEILSELVETYQLTTEGFSSPFDSYFIRSGRKANYPEKYSVISLFPQDAEFGCECDFFKTPIAGRRVWVNPPFIEIVLEKAARRCLDAVVADSSTTIVFYGPVWTDAAFYKLLTESSRCISTRTLTRGTYHFMTLERPVIAPIDTIIFILS
jgi:hypothetical protein